jgi:mono/diheme cytochrome c family protein
VLWVISEEPLAPTRIVRTIPRSLEAICLKCLEKKPQHRYESAEALAEDLRRFRNDLPVSTRRFVLPRRAARWVKRHPLITATAGFLIAGAVAFAALRPRPEEPPDPRVAAEQAAPQAKQILHKYCFECHGLDPNHVERDLNILVYSQLMDEKRRMVVPGEPAQSRLIQRIEDESMPPQKNEELPRVGLEERQILRTWIAGGAPPFPELTAEDFVVPKVEISPLAVKVKAIFTQKCRGCHKHDAAEGGIKILNHDMLVQKRMVVIPYDPAESELFRLVSYAPRGKQEKVMPPRDKNGKDTRLPAEEIEAIRLWIEAGAPPFAREKKSEGKEH